MKLTCDEKQVATSLQDKRRPPPSRIQVEFVGEISIGQEFRHDLLIEFQVLLGTVIFLPGDGQKTLQKLIVESDTTPRFDDHVGVTTLWKVSSVADIRPTIRRSGVIRKNSQDYITRTLLYLMTINVDTLPVSHVSLQYGRLVPTNYNHKFISRVET